MKNNLQPSTFHITNLQLSWLRHHSSKTGLNQAEIVRRAIDDYAERDEVKANRKLFSKQQREDIKQMAQAKGVSEVDIIRQALNQKLNDFFKRS